MEDTISLKIFKIARDVMHVSRVTQETKVSNERWRRGKGEGTFTHKPSTITQKSGNMFVEVQLTDSIRSAFGLVLDKKRGVSDEELAQIKTYLH